MKAFRRSSCIGLAIAIVCAAAFALLTALMPGMHPHAFAEEGATPALEVWQRVAAAVPDQDDACSYELTALTPGAPLPDGIDGAAYRWTMDGNAERTLAFPVQGVQPGVYDYEIRQMDGGVQDVLYDSAHYRASLYVTGPSPDGPRAFLLCYDASGAKTADVGWTLGRSASGNAIPSTPSIAERLVSTLFPKTGDGAATAAALGAIALAFAGVFATAAWRRRVHEESTTNRAVAANDAGKKNEV